MYNVSMNGMKHFYGITKIHSTIYIDKPIVSIRFDPPSPIIERQKSNVTLHCDVRESNPPKLTKVQWLIDSNLLTELPECNSEFF